MDSLLPAELLKASGTVVTASAAIYAVYSDRLEKIRDGKLTSKGRILIAVAILGLFTSVGAQLAQYAAVLKSAEASRKKSEQTSDKLNEVATRLQLEALAATPLRRMTYIAYFSDETTPEHLLDKNSFAVSVVFMRGSQSEFRIEAFPSSGKEVSGRVQLEGRDQRVAIPLVRGATYAGVYGNFKWQSHESTSLWVDLGFRNLIASLEKSTDGRYDYWPYRTMADMKDVWVHIEVYGTLTPRLSSSFLRLNEDLVLVIPPIVNGRAEIRSPLEAVKRVDGKT